MYFYSLLHVKRDRDVQCVYWNFNKNSRYRSSQNALIDSFPFFVKLRGFLLVNFFGPFLRSNTDGHGGWDDEGCQTHNSSSDYTTCLCNHLTHFGVLLV